MNARTSCASTIASLVVTMWAVFAGATAAQNFSFVPSPDSQDDPQLRLSTNASVYRQGELIPLELSFTSSVSNRYQVNTASYDRSGRMSYEKFLVEPANGTTDPVHVYFESSRVLMEGGLSNVRFLSDTPYVIHLDLNEWVRFDEPGNYRITVTSQRVSDMSGSKSFYRGEGLKSNSIDLRIIEPDEAWQQSELKRILADFDASPPSTGFLPNNQRLAAVTALRYLGSADAARELARHLRGDENEVDWACMFGLIGSPNRLAGYEEMKKLLVDPDFPVGAMFLTAIAIVPLDPAEPAEDLKQQRDANWKEARSTLTAAVSIKRGKALAVSVDTVLQNPGPNISQEDRSKLVSLLIEDFSELSTKEKRRWLGDEWSTVKDAAWLPTLRAIAAEYADYPVPYAPNQLPAYDYFKLSGDGLIHWYELDPEGARAAVLAEIVRQRPRFSANTLGMLPDEVLPNEERAIADHFLATDGDAVEGNLASLLNRYGDATVLEQVLPKIERRVGGAWACITQNNAVAYVQKVDPEVGKTLIERVSSGCRKFPSRSDLP
jgi:hypothetical protein